MRSSHKNPSDLCYPYDQALQTFVYRCFRTEVEPLRIMFRSTKITVSKQVVGSIPTGATKSSSYESGCFFC
jgi:hypothetical protein